MRDRAKTKGRIGLKGWLGIIPVSSSGKTPLDRLLAPENCPSYGN